MSTPRNITSRPASSFCCCEGGLRSELNQFETLVERPESPVPAAIRAMSNMRMSGGRLSEVRIAQMDRQGPRVLEVLDAVERQVEEVLVRHQQGDEVERRRDHLHRRDEARAQ